VCTAQFAGVERSVAYIATELARRGHESAIVGGTAATIGNELREADVEHLPAWTVRDAVGRLRSLRSRAPAMVHSHMTSGDIASVVARPWVRAPRVSTFHFAQPRGRTALRRAAYAWMDHCFTEQIAISAFVASRCESPAVVVPNGVPNPDRGELATDRAPIVLMVQRLEPEKDTTVGLEAWARCRLPHQGWTLEIAGDGSERARLEVLARDLRIESSVRFLGFRTDIATRMARAALFLATAPAEPFGLSVVEAMAARLPVLAAAGGAHNEVLAGFDDQVFRAGSADACRDALERIAADSEARTEAAQRGRRRFEERFTVERQVDALLGVYERAMSRSEG
jgi:glycosyltransferase involved in cell wall biosynthesis